MKSEDTLENTLVPIVGGVELLTWHSFRELQYEKTLFPRLVTVEGIVTDNNDWQ